LPTVFTSGFFDGIDDDDDFEMVERLAVIFNTVVVVFIGGMVVVRYSACDR